MSFFRSFRLCCVVVCCSGLCSIVLGCGNLDLFSVVSGVHKLRLFQIVSSCYRLYCPCCLSWQCSVVVLHVFGYFYRMFLLATFSYFKSLKVVEFVSYLPDCIRMLKVL